MFSSTLLYGLTAIFTLGSIVDSASLTRVNNYATTPASTAQMWVYIPDKLAANPAIVVALHGCGGTAQQFFQQTKYGAQADSKGFVLIYGSAANSDSNCWDVASKATLTHNGGSDSRSIVQMVQYAITQYKADPKRVFVLGTSSGGMMTNVLAATYPDVFAAGSSYSGVAAGCLAGSPGSSPTSANQACANGRVVHTAAEWGKIVHDMYPGYNGTYPKLQIWHGTADTFVNYPNLAEALKEWSNVHGVSFTGNQTNTPQSGYTKMVYGDGSKLVGYSAAGVGHVVPSHEADDMTWFGL